MTTSRRLAPLPLLLIGLAAIAVLVFIPWVVQAQTPVNQNATGRPVILASAEGAGILFADTEDIADGNGLPISGGSFTTFTWTYQWIRVDGDSQTNVGANSASYQPVEADVGKLIKVRVSFRDGDNFSETATSLPFGPITELTRTSATPSTLVSNTGQSHSAKADITQQYALGFRLGDHGQGYEISSVSIELAAVPSNLTVSLWSGSVEGGYQANIATKLFDFANPSSFAVGLNQFTAPAGAFAYQGVNYFIVLSGFGTTLSINETTSDAEDAGGETGAVIYNDAAVRALTATGTWAISTSLTSVLRLTLEGSERASGILASNYAQPKVDDKGTDDTSDDVGLQQEIISLGDLIGFGFELGEADRYLIRGVSLNSDDSTPSGSGFTNPFDLRSGSRTGTKQFSLTNTRKAPGLPVWTAPQGATVAGGCPTVMSVKTCKEYVFDLPIGADDGDENKRRRDAILFRVAGAPSDGVDSPPATGVSFTGAKGDVELNDPLMALLGVPLHAMVQNLGQADDGYRSVGSSSVKALTQGFTTGSHTGDYVLQGIGVNIEGSDSKFPDGPTSVSVSVHADSSGKPGAKLFDLVSPGEFGAGHSFFEAPPGTNLAPNTSYVMVWRYLGGTVHRLGKTGSNSEDSGALTGFSMANAFYQGVDLDNLAVDTGSDVLEIAVYSRSLPNATGRPIVLASAEDAGVLAVDTSGIGDPDGIPNVGDLESTGILYDFSYRWIRVDGDTERVVGAGSADYRQIGSTVADTGVRIESGRYRRVDADIGKLLKVEVSFLDGNGNLETVTSLPFGPLARLPSLPESTLVSNTGQSGSATANITGRYDMGFRLGNHGQGYEISSVSIDLAAAPSRLTVSLWMGRAPGSGDARAHTKLFDFENPSSFKAGPNGFTAPAGAFAYQNVDYFVVLSDFGSSLSIKETTSDAEDAGGDTAAALYNSAGGDTSVLRLAVKGSKRAHGILASSYAQDFGPQEIVSLGDDFSIPITLGKADRYLIRGMSFSMDNTADGGGFTNPWDLLDGTTEQFRLINTRQINGISEWTAPQGATVAGGCTTVGMVETCETYNFKAELEHPVSEHRFGGVVLSRHFGTKSTTEDSPSAAGVSLGSPTGDAAITRLLMAVLGEPLDAMVQNLGQTDNSYISLGGSNSQVLSQGFTTGSDGFGYRLQGIGVNIEGSDDSNGNAQVPSGPTSVSVAVHEDSNGQPGEKLFDLVSPGEFAAGHSFFEAPPGTNLAPNTSYVLVWSYLRGTWHRLQRTSSNGEDSGALTDTSIANAFRRGGDVTNLSEDSGGNSLEIAVYTEVITKAPFVPGGIEVPANWFHIPEDVEPGYQFRALFVTHRGRLPTSVDIDDYNDFVQEEAAGNVVRGEPVAKPYTDPVIQRVADQFKAVACTAGVNARTNTGMTGAGVPVHWLDGGWEDRPTLVANSNAEFYGPKWVNSDYGAYVTGNSAHFEKHSMVMTGCNASGDKHSTFFMGNTEATDMVAVGTPKGLTLKTRLEGEDADPNFAPLGAVDPSTGYPYHIYFPVIDGEKRERPLPLYAISPIFTVVGGTVAGPTALLVKNTGQSVSSNVNSLNAASPESAQEFTTGDNAGGYELVSIGVGFASIDTPSSAGAQLKVTLNADSSGDPGRALCTLTDPTSFSANAVNAFGRGRCPTLKAETTYFVVIDRVTVDSDSISLSETSSNNEDNGGTAGWSIEDDSSYLSGTTWTADANGESLLIEVIGTTN